MKRSFLVLAVAVGPLLAGCDDVDLLGTTPAELPLVELESVEVDETVSPAWLRIAWRFVNKTEETLYLRVHCSVVLDRRTGPGWAFAWSNPCASIIGTAVPLAPGESYADELHYQLSDFMREYIPSGIYRVQLRDVSLQPPVDYPVTPIATDLRVSPSFDFTFPGG